VAAVRAGYEVAAFDIFNDVETRRLCFYSERITFSNGGFDAEDLERALSNPELAEVTIVYGSGLENQLELLDKISRQFMVLGNTAAVVWQVKDPHSFFPLLDKLGIAHPETLFEMPLEPTGWLAKGIGGSGGTHVRHFVGQDGGYYQRLVQGIPASVLFLSDGADIEVVGYNEQWTAAMPDMPFRYGGAVGNAGLPDWCKGAMVDAARKLAAATGLRGLNSMDFILTDEAVLALEVNPRLSASFDLYDIPDLFDRHLQACAGRIPPLQEQPANSTAHLIYYAKHEVAVADGMLWPEWAVDLPLPGTLCRAGEPLCTVRAVGEDASGAKALVFARAQQLDAQLRTL